MKLEFIKVAENSRTAGRMLSFSFQTHELKKKRLINFVIGNGYKTYAPSSCLEELILWELFRSTVCKE